MKFAHLMLMILAALGCDDDCEVQSNPGLEELDEIRLSALNDGAAGAQIRADGRLVIDGAVPLCLSSCSTSSGTDCHIGLTPDGALRLQYDFQECRPTGSSGACDDACRVETMRCESDRLAPGEYTIEHRDERYTFTVGDSADPLDPKPFRQH